MQVKVDEIKVKKRIRKNMGNISQLAESLKTVGLLNPIVVTSDFELLAGHRRLEAAKKLGWKFIEANIVTNASLLQKLEIEVDENIHRLNFNPDEMTEAYDKLEKLRKPNFVQKLLNFFKNIFRSIKKVFSFKKRK